MRRDIFFKAKDKKTDHWVAGDFLFYSMQNFIVERGSLKRIKIEPETICQFVGIQAYWEDEEYELQEASLWEHDLLEIEYKGQTVVTEVKYECGSFILVSNELVDGYIPLLEVVELEETPWVHGKVVGNVFDNPELLEKNYDVER